MLLPVVKSDLCDYTLSRSRELIQTHLPQKKSDGTLEKVGINSKVGGKAETMSGLLRL